MKHQSGWKIRQLAGGVIEFTTPTGRVVTDEPMSRVFFHDSAEAEEEEQRAIVTEFETERIHRFEQDMREEATARRVASEASHGVSRIEAYLADIVANTEPDMRVTSVPWGDAV